MIFFRPPPMITIIQDGVRQMILIDIVATNYSLLYISVINDDEFSKVSEILINKNKDLVA